MNDNEFLCDDYSGVAGNDTGNIRQVKPRMWPNTADLSRCPIATYQRYAEKRPRGYSEPHHPFYIATSSKFCEAIAAPTDDMQWFRSQPIGVNKLSSLMSKMSTNAGLRHLTNHSARKHLVQKLNDAGVHPNQIMQVTGHKNIQSINNYSSLTINQQRGISSIIAGTVPSVSTAAASSVSSALSIQSTSAINTSSPSTSAAVHTLPAALGVSSASSVSAQNITAQSTSPVKNPHAVPTVPGSPSFALPGRELFHNCQVRVDTMNININYPTERPAKRRRIRVIESSESSQE